MGLVSENRGVGVPIVLLPWFGLDRHVMAAAFEPAMEGSSGWSRVYVDLPGCGESPAGPENSDGVVEALFAYLDATLGSEPFLLAGCSYGGYLAAAIARHRTEQVAGLLLVCPGIKILPEDRVLPEGSPDPSSDDWLVDVDPALHEHLNQALGQRSREVVGRIGRLLSGASSRDETYLARLRTTGYQLSDENSRTLYEGPTLVLTGREDRIVGYADQYHALRSYPQATYAVLSRAGHYLPLEQPASFRRFVQDWLDRCSPTPH